jgi:hypothetical protein
MRPREDELIDPEIAEQLDAIDATLAGDPVDPRFAEIAELALLLAASRPEPPRPEFAAELDRRVQARFRAAAEPAARSGSPDGARAWWRVAPWLGAAGTALAAVVAAVVVVTAVGGTPATRDLSAANHGREGLAVRQSAASAAAQSPPSAKAAAPLRNGAHQSVVPAQAATSSAPGAGGAASAGSTPTTATTVTDGAGATVNAPTFAAPLTITPSPPAATPSPAPVPNGRRIVQSSTLALGAPAKRIDAVAQEIFNVVAQVNAIVQRSNVVSTGGLDANAQFQLRVPSSELATALTLLSRLRYASVISRTDATQDVNSPYLSGQRDLAAAERTRAALRVQLAAATTDTEIAALKTKLVAVNAEIARDSAALTSLNRRIAYSQVYVSLQASTVTPVAGDSGGGFGLHQAGHDAIRVLEVSAGVALIALAVLLPLALLAALAWWIAAATQRRRRERALDMA